MDCKEQQSKVEHFRLATVLTDVRSQQEIKNKMLQGVTRLANDKGEHEVDEGGDGLPG